VAWAGQSKSPRWDSSYNYLSAAYSPELQPAETLWSVVDEPIVNKHIATIEELDAKIANQCVALVEQPEQIQSRTNFHWWPKPIIPN